MTIRIIIAADNGRKIYQSNRAIDVDFLLEDRKTYMLLRFSSFGHLRILSRSLQGAGNHHSAHRFYSIQSRQAKAMTLAAAGQFCATASVAANLESVKILIRKAVDAGAKVLFLPEASDYIAGSPAETVALARSADKSEFVLGIQDELKKLEKPLEVSVGIHESVEGEERCKNTLLWIDSKGEITQRYQKLHLFDVSMKNGPILMESRSVQPGNEVLPPFDTPIGKMGYAICYDIRFPEHALRLRTLGAQIITYPSAFTVRTGQAHWELLGRARAVDTQTYVVMAAQVGAHDSEGKRRSWGHAMIIDPWGSVLAQCPDTDSVPRICVADIDLDVIEKVRTDMPLWQQRRGASIYGSDV